MGVQEIRTRSGYTYYKGTKFVPKLQVRGAIAYLRTPVGICEADLYDWEGKLPALCYVCPRCGHELLVTSAGRSPKEIEVHVERDNPRPVMEEGRQIGKDIFVVTVRQPCTCDHYLDADGLGGGDKCRCTVKITDNVMSITER